MEMCANGALVMPKSYAVMNEEEMTYVEGGAIPYVDTNLVAWAIDVGCALAGIYASACGELMGRALISLIKTTWKKCSGKVATILGTTAASAIGIGIGKLNQVAGMMISCLSFGGIIGLGLDALDGTLDSKYKW